MLQLKDQNDYLCYQEEWNKYQLAYSHRLMD